jgi:ketol-acid reductoisomerase
VPSYTQENIILYLRDSYQNELYKKELQNWINKIGVIKYDMPFNCPYKRHVFWIN